jgi:hypothetical protein
MTLATVCSARVGLGRTICREHDSQGSQDVALCRVGGLQEALVVAGPRPAVADGVMAPSTDRIKWIGASPLFEYGTCRRFQGFADRQKVSQMS